jgi:hypothetical protein
VIGDVGARERPRFRLSHIGIDRPAMAAIAIDGARRHPAADSLPIAIAENECVSGHFRKSCK